MSTQPETIDRWGTEITQFNQKKKFNILKGSSTKEVQDMKHDGAGPEGIEIDNRKNFVKKSNQTVHSFTERAV